MKKNKADTDDENVIAIYLKEINQIPLLTKEEEDFYARKAATGDDSAKKKLVKANLRFVVNVAKRYQNHGIPLIDLISEGNIGLLTAIDKYDINRGYHFISYAVWWIRQAILKAICEKSRMIKLPLNKANELVQIEKAKKELLKENGVVPEIKDIAKYLNMDPDYVARLVNISRDLISLETPVFIEKDSTTLSDFIEGSQYKTPDQTMIQKGLKEDINNVLKTLSVKEAEVIMDRFGLNGRKPLSLKEIGEKFNLSKERIRQIERMALKRLKHPSKAELLKTYLIE
ncbi:MAG: sigma-70 family RNA polymerase sigma factor [Spirochaetales bacterium]|nr:sigma-70 family RNA polymerase sigma factor [Spirochaetales bacterium]